MSRYLSQFKQIKTQEKPVNGQSKADLNSQSKQVEINERASPRSPIQMIEIYIDENGDEMK